MTSPLSTERLREYADTALILEVRGMARELLLLRERSAVAAADRALVDCIIGVGLEGMKPRRAGDPVCPEGYILVGLPFYDACRAARAQEQETSMNAAEGGDAPRTGRAGPWLLDCSPSGWSGFVTSDPHGYLPKYHAAGRQPVNE